MSKLIKSRAGHRGHVRKLVYEWPGLRVEKDAVLSEESRCRLEYTLETMNTKILLLQKLDDDVLKEVEDGDRDISEEIIATCEYMDDVSIQRDLLKRYLLSTVERLTSANSLASTQHFSSSLEPAAASVTFDSCGRGTCSSIGAESGAQAPQAMATAGWNPAAALATSTPGGPSTLATCRDPDDALLDGVKRFWDLEAIGITSNEHTVHEAFKHSITHDGERYTVHLPWREMHPALPDGYHLSKKRLESTFRKSKKSPEILKEYDAVIQDQLKRSIVERVVYTNDIPGEVHYLPHHPVIRQASQQLSDDQCSDFTQWSSALRVQLQQQRKLHWPHRLTFRLMCRLDPAEPPLRSPLQIPEHWLVVVRFECYRFTGT